MMISCEEFSMITSSPNAEAMRRGTVGEGTSENDG